MARRNGRAKPTPSLAQPQEAVPGITRISVAGFKSIVEEQSAEIRPLTILAGANSSGKSSLMQPLLLMKQTLEAPYDPGALKLDEPNVRFSSANEFLSRTTAKGSAVDAVTVSFVLSTGERIVVSYEKAASKPLRIGWMSVDYPDYGTVRMLEGMASDDAALHGLFARWQEIFTGDNVVLRIGRDRCFLGLGMSDAASPTGSFAPFPVATDAVQVLRRALREIIHLPGLRDNPARTYSLTAVGETFPGTFDNYFASIIARWQDEGATGKLEGLGDDLAALGLTWKVATRAVSDTQVEVKVGRLPHARQGGAHDLVSIADVGIGVSQVLPVLVALRAAQAGQLVYLEQPEIHLHPRAQGVLSSVLAAAVSRGVRVVVETHSAHLLLGVQTCVAEGKLLPEAVKLHWFERSPEDGTTQIIGADLNENGAFGDWPVDFTDVEFEADSAYLDAIDSRRRGAQAV